MSSKKKSGSKGLYPICFAFLLLLIFFWFKVVFGKQPLDLFWLVLIQKMGLYQTNLKE